MTAETIGIILSAATLVVITAAAIAAIVQLRHLRASNQLNALLTILSEWNRPELQAAYTNFVHELPAKLARPEYVKELTGEGAIDRATHPEFLVFDFWEQVGTYAKYGLVDEQILLDICSAQVLKAWRTALPAVKIVRSISGPASFENFEYLAMRSKQFNEKYPSGTYPRNAPRLSD